MELKKNTYENGHKLPTPNFEIGENEIKLNNKLLTKGIFVAFIGAFSSAFGNPHSLTSALYGLFVVIPILFGLYFLIPKVVRKPIISYTDIDRVEVVNGSGFKRGWYFYFPCGFNKKRVRNTGQKIVKIYRKNRRFVICFASENSNEIASALRAKGIRVIDIFIHQSAKL